MTSTTQQQQGPKGLMDEDGRIQSKIVLDHDEPSATIHFATLGNVGPALAMIVVCLALVYVIPGLEFARPWSPGEPVPFWNVLSRPFEHEVSATEQARVAEVKSVAAEVLTADLPQRKVEPEAEVIEVAPGERLPPYQPHPDDDKPVVQSIELFAGHELDRFFSALTRSDARVAGAMTRVVHWGDSAIGMDGITGAIRLRMQARFGDAGHGFHLMAPPNTSYRHGEVRFRHNDLWKRCFIIMRCKKDGYYGLGGTTFRSTGGAVSSFAPHPKRSSGRVSRFELWYAAQPRGGRIRLRVDGGDPVFIDTKADVLEDRWHAIEVADGAHQLEVRASGSGRVRLYGVTLERDGPGVVWDGLALVGAFTNRMLGFNEEHLRAQLNHRKADLAVFMFGGNDMIRTMKMSDYAEEYRKVIGLVRRARPDMDCVIMTPLDHGLRKGVRIVSQPVVPQMVDAQREVARSEGCAFFNTFQAMGGDGSAGRWYRSKPRLIGGDLSHATFKGHQVIGELFYRALIEAYVAYRKRNDATTAAAADAPQ